MKRQYCLFILFAIVAILLFLKFPITRHAEGLPMQGQKKTNVKTVADLTTKPVKIINSNPKPQKHNLTPDQKNVKNISCNDYAINNNTFSDFIKQVSINPNFCGAGLHNSVIKTCASKSDKPSEPACLQVFLKFASLLTADLTFDQPQNLSDKILKIQIAKMIFSTEGFQNGGPKKTMPLLLEVLRRYPDDVGLLRVFTMIRSATALLHEPLSEADNNILNLALSKDSENVSTRNALVTIYTRQEEGFEMISRMARAYPNDIYPYATLAGGSLLENDRKGALEWAEFGLKKNPNNKQFLLLKQDLENGVFNINKYYNFHFDISGAFDDILLQ
ncbi:MAG: hypothetical protein AABY53_05875 [Bdellovibrionota bacterium]